MLDDAVSVVVVTHLYGRMADVGAIRAGCAGRGASACSRTAPRRSAPSGPAAGRGAVGDVAAFSFYPTKNLGALGDGGAVATARRAELADARAPAAPVRLVEASTRSRREGGRNSRLDELQAAVLRVRLPRVDAGNERRREIIGALRGRPRPARA